ncbi:MAG: CtsR family transcriptional regulator [Clostridiales bacterium]|nr:CtsR family transcriptional regulator [Clostridiales bacterium]MBD9010127.1 CtsR family transcriptional regulator [Clostridiales bacterium]
MKLTSLIEDFIKEMMSEEDGTIELKRNELASRFGCVPSQINYVISTRFSPERGYIVESRRGGGGYIKIQRVMPKPGNQMMHVVNAIGDYVSYSDAAAIVRNCYDYDLITEKEARIILAAITEKSMPIEQPQQDALRARMLKNILVAIA